MSLAPWPNTFSHAYTCTSTLLRMSEFLNSNDLELTLDNLVEI